MAQGVDRDFAALLALHHVRATFDIAALRQPAVGPEDGDLGKQPAQLPSRDGKHDDEPWDLGGAHFSDTPRDSIRFNEMFRSSQAMGHL